MGIKRGRCQKYKDKRNITDPNTVMILLGTQVIQRLLTVY
jgi:hypothetical protein